MLSNLKRLNAKKISLEEREPLIQEAVKNILNLVTPLQVFLIGSALTDTFDEHSDLDLVLVFETSEICELSRRKLYRNAPPSSVSIEYICVDKKTYETKSDVGGILYIAKKEGRLLFKSN